MKQLQKIACDSLVIFRDETEFQLNSEIYFCGLVIVFDAGNVARQIIYIVKRSVNLPGDVDL